MLDALRAVMRGESLDSTECRSIMDSILAGEVAPEQIGAFLIALSLKGETSSELTGFVQALRAQMTPIKFSSDRASADILESCVDVCGTGGDGAQTFNVSTCVAFVVAAAGVKVAKHGNRAVSSRSGSSDVLSALGVEHSVSATEIETSLVEHGLSFLFAPIFHPVLSKVAPIRKNIGVRTSFNVLGPLLNPLEIRRQLVGVFNDKYLKPVAETLLALGSKEVMVVCGEGGFDEVSLVSTTKYAHLKHGEIAYGELSPETFGLPRCELGDLRGGDAILNAGILREILSGQRGPKSNLVIANAAAALMIAGKVSNLKDGVALAGSILQSGRALELLMTLISQDIEFKVAR